MTAIAQPRRSLLELLRIALAITVAWLVVAVFNASDFYHLTVVLTAWHGQPEDFTIALILQLVTSLNWAFCTPLIVFFAERYLIAPPHVLRNSAIVAAFIAVTSVVRAVFGGVVLELGEHKIPTLWMAQESIRVRYHRWAFYIAVLILIVNLVHAYREAGASEHRSLTRQAELARAELARLRARLQPRFMFATLRAIAQRIRPNPDEADELLVSLSALLRRSLEFDRRSEVTLRDELDFVDQYLQIERASLAGRLTWRIDVDDVLLRAKVPPMLVHTLVESAIVSDGDRGDSIERIDNINITGRHDGTRLRLLLRSSRGVAGEEALHGTRERLRQLFAERQSVEVRQEGETWVTEISLPLHLSIEVAA